MRDRTIPITSKARDAIDTTRTTRSTRAAEDEEVLRLGGDPPSPHKDPKSGPIVDAVETTKHARAKGCVIVKPTTMSFRFRTNARETKHGKGDARDAATKRTKTNDNVDVDCDKRDANFDTK